MVGAVGYEVQIRYFDSFWGATQSVTGTSTTVNDFGLGTAARVRTVGCNGLRSGWVIASGANALARDASPSEDPQKSPPSESQQSAPSESPQSAPSDAGTSGSGASQKSTSSDAETSPSSD